MSVRLRRQARPQRPATRSGFSRSLLAGVAVVALIGCEAIGHRPKVIAVPGEHVPHHLEQGEAAPTEGWLLPTPLFNELLPCFKGRLEGTDGPPRDVPRPEP